MEGLSVTPEAEHWSRIIGRPLCGFSPRRSMQIDLDRPRDVLDGLLPARLDFDRHLVAHLLRSTARYVDAAGIRQRLDPGGDIHAIAIDVVAIDDDVTDIDADPELYPTVFGAVRIAFANLLLDLDRAGDSVHGARELHQRAVTHEFDRPARMGRDQRIDEVAPDGLQTGERPGLVDTHEARVSDHIG